MPLTERGRRTLEAMQRQYGAERGMRIFYASINKGTIQGAEGKRRATRWSSATRKDRKGA